MPPQIDPKRFQIRIESVLGGHSRSTHFASKDQFRSSIGIDPGSPLPRTAGNPYTSGAGDPFSFKPCGLIRPVQSTALTGTIGSAPLWIEGSPSTNAVFVYDASGSVYAHVIASTAFTALSDAGATTGSGNGMAYYDNYMYFATNTDIARYGPLNSPDAYFTPNYWTTVLGLTALTDRAYPVTYFASNTLIEMRNHYLHRHSDGRLYIADIVGNVGYLHYIQTTKTTVEGDTNAGSTYLRLRLGVGMAPTCIESLGANLVIAVYESNEKNIAGQRTVRSKTGRAKIAFWDTTSQNMNAITWVEFPDGLITAMKNVNGTLYVFSTSTERCGGFRVSRYVGGYTFEEVYSSEEALAPLPGAVDGVSSRLVFGSATMSPSKTGCIFSLGLSANGLSNGVFCPFVSSLVDDTSVSALMLAGNAFYGKGWDYPVFGVSNNDLTHRLESIVGYDNCNSVFWSQLYRIGQRFRIVKIKIPITEALTADTTIVPRIYTDDGFGTTFQLQTINQTNFGTQRAITLRPMDVSTGQPITGESNFMLGFQWSESYPMTIGLPITIEYELIPDTD